MIFEKIDVFHFRRFFACFFVILKEHMWRPVGAGHVRSMEAQNAYTGIKTGQANKNIWKHRGHVHTYACWSKLWPLRIWVDFKGGLWGGGRPDLGRAGRIWGGPKLDFRGAFFLIGRKSRKNPESVRRRNGSDEIWQKVRKVKEGSRHFWWLWKNWEQGVPENIREIWAQTRILDPLWSSLILYRFCTGHVQNRIESQPRLQN